MTGVVPFTSQNPFPHSAVYPPYVMMNMTGGSLCYRRAIGRAFPIENLTLIVNVKRSCISSSVFHFKIVLKLL